MSQQQVQPEVFIIKENNAITYLNKSQFKVVGDTIYTQNGLQYKVNNRHQKYRTMAFDVQRVEKMSGGSKSGGQSQFVKKVYEDMLKDVPAKFQKGLQEFLTYQFDVDASLVKRFGSGKLQQIFRQHDIENRPVEPIDAQFRYKLMFEGPDDNAEQLAGDGNDERSEADIGPEMKEAIDNMFDAEPDELVAIRDEELASQTKLKGEGKKRRRGGYNDYDTSRSGGYRGGADGDARDEQNCGCDDAVIDLNIKEVGKCYNYDLELQDNFMEQFMGTGKMKFVVDKKKKRGGNVQRTEALTLFRKAKRYHMQGGDVPVENAPMPNAIPGAQAPAPAPAQQGDQPVVVNRLGGKAAGFSDTNWVPGNDGFDAGAINDGAPMPLASNKLQNRLAQQPGPQAPQQHDDEESGSSQSSLSVADEGGDEDDTMDDAVLQAPPQEPQPAPQQAPVALPAPTAQQRTIKFQVIGRK